MTWRCQRRNCALTKRDGLQAKKSDGRSLIFPPLPDKRVPGKLGLSIPLRGPATSNRPAPAAPVGRAAETSLRMFGAEIGECFTQWFKHFVNVPIVVFSGHLKSHII